MRRILRSTLLLLCLACTELACVGGARAPTPETIAGVWIEQCQTRDKQTTTCSARTDTPFRFEFRPGGGFAKTLNGFDACSSSSWALQGVSLETLCEGGGMSLRERWRARLVGARLVLWSDDVGGRVLVREGAGLSGAPETLGSDTELTRRLDAVEYTVRMPAGYYVAEETAVSDRFASSAPSALEYRFKLGHAARPVGERGGCEGYGGELSRDDDGAMRILCVDSRAGLFTLSCWARRADQRALTDEQFAAAQDVCGSVRAR